MAFHDLKSLVESKSSMIYLGDTFVARFSQAEKLKLTFVLKLLNATLCTSITFMTSIIEKLKELFYHIIPGGDSKG